MFKLFSDTFRRYFCRGKKGPIATGFLAHHNSVSSASFSIVFSDLLSTPPHPIEITLKDFKISRGDNQSYSSLINAVTVLYDWNRVSHSSKAFLEHILYSVSYDYGRHGIRRPRKPKIKYGHAPTLQQVMHHVVNIGICLSSSFPRKEQCVYIPSSRCIQEAFTQAALRNSYVSYARIRQEWDQLERCLVQHIPIVCTMDATLLSSLKPKTTTPVQLPENVTPPPTRKSSRRLFSNAKSALVYEAFLLIGFDREKSVFKALHFTKPNPEMIEVPYDVIGDSMYTKDFFVLLGSLHSSANTESFKMINS
jgi:hypothetical protein